MAQYDCFERFTITNDISRIVRGFPITRIVGKNLSLSYSLAFLLFNLIFFYLKKKTYHTPKFKFRTPP